MESSRRRRRPYVDTLALYASVTETACTPVVPVVAAISSTRANSSGASARRRTGSSSGSRANRGRRNQATRRHRAPRTGRPPPQPRTASSRPPTSSTAVTPWTARARTRARRAAASRPGRRGPSVVTSASSFSPCCRASLCRRISRRPVGASGCPGSTFQSQAAHHATNLGSVRISVPHSGHDRTCCSTAPSTAEAPLVPRLRPEPFACTTYVYSSPPPGTQVRPWVRRPGRETPGWKSAEFTRLPLTPHMSAPPFVPLCG